MGNYDQYMKLWLELEENQVKRFYWEQDQICECMKKYLARFGYGGVKLAQQAHNKQNTEKDSTGTDTETRHCHFVTHHVARSFHHHYGAECEPHVHKRWAWHLLYNNLEFGINLNTYVALAGPNGAAKSTLLKLLIGELLTHRRDDLKTLS